MPRCDSHFTDYGHSWELFTEHVKNLHLMHTLKFSVDVQAILLEMIGKSPEITDMPITLHYTL